ncbi:glycosyltransferase family 2 protein [Inmirania thermothiophila]|uniref:Dolichol-phosphate mannosyltransferase n=1 Tax=Inmirania thermothiophila TaxID=1750597 RepID=A0A3N1Y8L3_9GAMM|nr:glycosyltransferase family 2 protein [Inmirania thermothiophila]ROR34881.1 dolichol-phosphate mannosyltransferase [Inmirania thermothiophila]
MELSLVIPMHNEAENVEPLLGEIRAALEGAADYEVVVVDDGSDDDTPRILARVAAGFPRLRVIRHRTSCGQSTAIRTGVRAARGTWICTLDGDGQNDPADIPRLWAVAREEAAEGRPLLVAGWRRSRRDTWIRRLSSRIANGVRARLLRDATPDTGCGLKVFRRADFLELPYFDHMHRFLPALFLRAGGRVRSVEVHHRPRERGRSHYGIRNRLWVGIVDLLGVMWLMRRARVPVIEEA